MVVVADTIAVVTVTIVVALLLPVVTEVMAIDLLLVILHPTGVFLQ
jgi:hypothetical protein